MKIRRRKYCFLQLDDRLLPDIDQLLEGRLATKRVANAALLCPISGRSLKVTPDELAAVATLSGESWTELAEHAAATGLPAERLESLVRREVILCDRADAPPIAQAEERLAAVGWLPIAALYRAQTSWQNVKATTHESAEGLKAELAAHAERFGPPPHHFVRRADAIDRVALPVEAEASPLRRILEARLTVRSFDTTRALPLNELSRILDGTWGVRGITEWTPELAFLKKTSPSGGALHPIEPYPVVAKVAGIAPGVYHYDAGARELELLRRLTEQEARDLITHATAGQPYFAEAHACVLHVGRFERTFWKYRSHAKAYNVMLFDAAHLSQTFYLLATERGLGAYFTAAVNDANLGELLALDSAREAVLALNGLGLVDERRTHLNFRPDRPV